MSDDLHIEVKKVKRERPEWASRCYHVNMSDSEEGFERYMTIGELKRLKTAIEKVLPEQQKEQPDDK